MLPLIVRFRWVNMDVIFVSSMIHHLRVRKIISYDIACQWSKGLLTRIAKFPSHLQIPLPAGELKYVIPKLHWASHERINHSKFSLNFVPGAARTDGEGVERIWWGSQSAANSTKQMGPGGRQGYLEDVWGHSNWTKIINLGESTQYFPLRWHILIWERSVAELLRRRYILARKMAALQAAAFKDMSAGLLKENTVRWEADVSAWEADMSRPDPYIIIKTGKYSVQ